MILRSLIIFTLCLTATFLMLYACGNRMTVTRAALESGNNTPDDAQPSPEITELPADPLLNEGLSLFRSGDFGLALEKFKMSLAIDSTNWLSCYYHGLSQVKLGVPSAAGRSLHRSLEYAPADKRLRSRIYTALGETREMQGEYQRAKLDYLTALNLNPESADAQEGIDRIESITTRAGR